MLRARMVTPETAGFVEAKIGEPVDQMYLDNPTYFIYADGSDDTEFMRVDEFAKVYQFGDLTEHEIIPLVKA